MTRDDIERMAHEAGITYVTGYGVASATFEWLERFAALVAAAERQRCADIAVSYASIEGIAQTIAAEIRGRA
jgi:hypothetical protein